MRFKVVLFVLYQWECMVLDDNWQLYKNGKRIKKNPILSNCLFLESGRCFTNGNGY